MTDNGTVAVVASRPECDLCTQEGETSEALYDGKTRQGPWGYMCQAHFDRLGVGLGTGRGQKLVTVTERRQVLTVRLEEAKSVVPFDGAAVRRLQRELDRL